MTIRSLLTTTLVIALACPVARAAEPDPLAALERATTPFLQLPNPGLDGYQAEVEMSGNAMLGFVQIAKAQSLESPRFVERMDASGKLGLTVANEGYPQDVVGEIERQLLPFQLFFTTTREANAKELQSLRRQAQAEMAEVELDGAPCVRVDLTPTGEALMIQARMLPGGGRRVSRTTRTSFWIEKARGAVRRLVSVSESRDESADGAPTGELLRREMRYDVDWDEVEGRVVPLRIVQAIDGFDTFEQRLSYRVEEQHVVFDRRETDYFQRERLGLRATALAEYKSYQFGSH